MDKLFEALGLSDVAFYYGSGSVVLGLAVCVAGIFYVFTHQDYFF